MYKWTNRTAMALANLCFLLVPAWNQLHATGEQASARMMRVTVGVLCGATSNQPVVESGILVGDGAWVLTNNHVISKSGSEGCIVFGPELKMNAHLKDADEETDLALLELDSPSRRPGAVFASHLSRGQAVIALGYPKPGADKRFDDYSGSGSEGQLTGLRTANGVNLIETNMTFSSRDTGGPLFTKCGEVAGVNEESANDAAIAGGYAYALLQKNDVQVDEAATACQPAGIGTTQLGEETGVGETIKPRGGASTTSEPAHWPGDIQAAIYTLKVVLGIITTLLAAMGFTKKGRETLTRAYQTVRYGRSTAYTPQQHTPPQCTPQSIPPPLAAPAVPRPRLLAVVGPLSGRSFVLEGGITSIGRDPSLCQIVFPADTTKVSRHHCSLRLDLNGSILLEDCGSANGTFLASGARMEAGRAHRIQVGERFYLGSGSIGFELHGANA